MEITFEKGLLGLESLKKYRIEDIEDNEDFKLISSIEDPDISLVIISPFKVKEDYEIDLSDETVKNLQIDSSEDVLLYTTVTVNSDVKKITTNLRAPLVINKKNNLAEQVVLSKEAYEIKYPLVKE